MLPVRHEFLKDLLEKAKELMEKDGYIVPAAFVETEDKELLILDCKQPIEEGKKDELVKVLKDTAKKTNATMIVMLMEAWTLQTEKDKCVLDVIEEAEKIGGIGKHPNAVENVVMTVETYDGAWLAVAPIYEKDGKRTFNIPNLTSSVKSEGRFFNLLPAPSGEKLN